MAGLNKVMLIGRLGKDPESRSTAGGESVVNFSVATSETWTDRNGEKQEKTEWHNIVIWGKLAEIAARYLTKGSQVYLEGKLQTRKYTDRDGNERRTTEVVVRNMTMLGGKRQENGGGNPDYGLEEPAAWDNDTPF